MAGKKTMANSNGKKRVTKNPRKQNVPRGPRELTLLGKHINMILDPCGAPLTETAYTGPTGTIQRYVVTGALNATTQQAGFVVMVPGGFRESTGVIATGGTSFTPGYGAANVPGYTTLNAVSGAVRVVGACLQLHWNASETTRGGSIACGVAPASIWTATTTATVDQLYGMLPRKERIPSGECEIVWNPSEQDMGYNKMDGSVTQPDFDDKNALGFAYMGPAGFSIAYTYTVIYEWTPKLGTGQPAHPTIHKSVIDPISQINSTLFNMGFQNKPLVNMARKTLSTLATYTPAGNMLRMVKTAAGVVNTLLP